MQRLDQAIVGLEQALTDPPRYQAWPHLVRQRLSGLEAALVAERPNAGDPWLSARAGHLHRERNRLRTRLRMLRSRVTEAGTLDPVRQDLLRLLHDIQHHHQRVNDLVYDAVGMDVGGSE